MAIRHAVSVALGFIVILIGGTCELLAKRHKRPWYCESTEDGDHMSFLWTVKRDPPAYFFGTIHVPYTRVWDHIPDNAKQAFEASDNVFFELDLMDPRTISALAGCQMLPQGENLSDLLPPEMYRRLKRHLDYVKGMMPSWMTSDQRGRGLYADYLFNAITGNWERKRPVWVMLMVNSLTESDVKARGIPVLDLYLAQEAERMNKRTGAVERVEEQCVPLNGLNVSQVLFALNQTLYQHESIKTGDLPATYTTDDLIKHYNCGDLNDVIFNHDTTQVPSLVNGSLSPLELILARNIDDYFRQELIYRRNKRMGGRVAQLLKAYPDESFFFAFGAGHFLGNNTVLDFVREAGFEVEHTPPQKKIWSSAKRSRDNRKLASSTESSAWSRLSELVPHGNGFDSSEEERARRLGVRKRPAHVYHSAVYLLRTTTPRPKPRKFNDLWVRLETLTTREPYMSPHEAKDTEVFQNSLRVWYGLPSSGQQYRVCWWTLALCLTATFWGLRRFCTGPTFPCRSVLSR